MPNLISGTILRSNFLKMQPLRVELRDPESLLKFRQEWDLRIRDSQIYGGHEHYATVEEGFHLWLPVSIPLLLRQPR